MAASTPYKEVFLDAVFVFSGGDFPKSLWKFFGEHFRSKHSQALVSPPVAEVCKLRTPEEDEHGVSVTPSAVAPSGSES